MGNYGRREVPTPQERFYYILYDGLKKGMAQCNTAVNAECTYNKHNEVTDTYVQLIQRDWLSLALFEEEDYDNKLCEAIADELIRRAKEANLTIKTPKSINFLCLSAYKDTFIETHNHAKLIIAVLGDDEMNDFVDNDLPDFEYMPETIKEWGCVVLNNYINIHADTISMFISVKLGLSEENAK